MLLNKTFLYFSKQKINSRNTQAIENLEKQLNLTEAERKKIHDAPEPEMDKIRRAINRLEARRAIIEEQLHAVDTLPDEHRFINAMRCIHR